MIPSKKIIGALCGIQAMVIMARFFARREEDFEKIESLLDDCDHLFNLILEPSDNTSLFHKTILAYSEKHQLAIISHNYLKGRGSPKFSGNNYQEIPFGEHFMESDLLIAKASGLKEGIELLKSKEKQANPTKQFADQFNQFLNQVKENVSDPDVLKLLPESIPIENNIMGLPLVRATYGEIYSYLSVIERVLSCPPE